MRKIATAFIITISVLTIMLIYTALMSHSNLILLFIPIVLILIFMIYWLISTNAKNIDLNSINIEKKEDNKIIVTYENYKFETKIEYKARKLLVPKIDMNGNKIGIIKRETLHNYLLNNYDSLSLPNDMTSINDNEVKKYFINMTICTEEAKNKFLNRRHFIGLYIIILIFILFNLKTIIQGIIEKEIPTGLIITLTILISILILSFILVRKSKQKEKNAEIYSCKVDIYDKKEVESGEGDLSYYVRVYNGDKHVLNKWFNINKDFYINGTQGTLYLIMYGDKCETDFEVN